MGYDSYNADEKFEWGFFKAISLDRDQFQFNYTSDEEKFLKLQECADSGSIEAIAAIAACYEEGIGVEASHEKAIYYYKIAADYGLASAEVSLGMCYEFGRGVESSYSKALSIYEMAAEKGYAPAYECLSRLYGQGLGVPKSLAKSNKYDRLAFEKYKAEADKGDISSQCAVGIFYLEEIGVERSAKLAVRYLQKAADQGHYISQLQLGVCLFNYSSDKESAFRYLKLAQQNIPNRLTKMRGYCEAYLAACFESGIGVQSDIEMANHFYTLAAEKGNMGAIMKLNPPNSEE